MRARIRRGDGAEQPLRQHSLHVAGLCARAAQGLRLERMAWLLGLLHDLGKATEVFQRHLLACVGSTAAPASPHPHAPAGAIFVYRRWFCAPGATPRQRLTAQMLALCILGHHAGLTDCLDATGDSAFLRAMQQPTGPLHYEEAVQWFRANVCAEQELDALFAEACAEIAAFLRERIQPCGDERARRFQLGMLTRLLLSILVDADRWDAACFAHGQDAMQRPDAPDWARLLETFETFRRERLDDRGVMGRLRGAVSDRCFAGAGAAPGLYTLSVPTGGGKTYASLRFALRHAALHGKRRIVYIAPYNTILDQNAQDIRRALADHPSILEHHADVVVEDEAEQEVHDRLTERWDSDVVLTSLVRAMDACFSASNTDVRRLYRLCDAVLIFDEIQALPKHCKTLFEQAVTFLSACCGSTVLLCTATQPRLTLSPPPRELVPDAARPFQALERVRYVPQIARPYSDAEAAVRLAELLEDRSVLTIVNTRAVAWDLHRRTTERLRAAGRDIVTVDQSLTEDEIRARARRSGPRAILCVHLTTLLCPAHRKRAIGWIKLWLEEGAAVSCVSTSLIEAGIDVSFPVVVRSLAGLPSIVQAAGRADRGLEYGGHGVVYIWDLYEERRPPEIQTGGTIARSMLAGMGDAALDAPARIADYFAREQERMENDATGPLARGQALYRLLSGDAARDRAAALFASTAPLVLRQSFRTAYRAFAVIPQETVSVLVPFGEGAALIERLSGAHTMREEIALLRRAQGYSVSLYEDMFRRLREEGVIRPVGETGAFALRPGHYDEVRGVEV